MTGGTVVPVPLREFFSIRRRALDDHGEMVAQGEVARQDMAAIVDAEAGEMQASAYGTDISFVTQTAQLA